MSIQTSIIIPCYNHAHFLPDAVGSVLAQTGGDWEAIIVDDGSTDNTREVAARFTGPRIRYIYQENHGLSAARNAGIRAAQGEYLIFLDADDALEIDFLGLCTAALTARPDLVGVYTLCSFVDSLGQRLPAVGGQCVAESEFRARNLEGGFFPIHAALVRTSVVCDVGQFDESLTSEEDWDLWFRVSERGRLLCVPQPLVRYRVYTGSMSTNAQRMHTNAVAVLTKYLGPPEGDPKNWSADKRKAYGFASRGAAYGFVQQHQPDRAWQLVAEAAALWPPLLERLDTFYELVLGDQTRGYRGEARQLDIAARAADILGRLDALFSSADATVLARRGAAYGNAYLALAMLSDQAGDWAAARRYLLKAARHNPRLLTGSFLRRLLKLCLGTSAVHWLKSIRSRDADRPKGASEG